MTSAEKDVCEELSDEEEVNMDEKLDLFDSDTVEKIRQAKLVDKTKFVSHWEADEEDIQAWTDVK